MRHQYRYAMQQPRGSRHADRARMRERPEWRSSLVLKKIDSTMRGNIAAEIAAARAVLQPRITLLAPAFPALGRTVRDGSVHIAEGGPPIPITEHLEGFRCAAIPILPKEELVIRFAQAIEEGIDILIPDTWNEIDLRVMAEAALEIDGLLWVGSGGLAQRDRLSQRLRPPAPSAAREDVKAVAALRRLRSRRHVKTVATSRRP